MPQYLHPTKQTSEGSTQSSAISSSANAFMSAKGAGGFSQFQQGFKVGYTSVMQIGGTWLAYRAAKQEKALMKMNADLMNLQAQSYETAADDVMAGGERQAAAIGYEAGQAKSTTKTRQAAAGVRVGGSGSAAEVLTSIDIVKEMQVNQVMANAVAESWGYRRSAVDYKNQALAYRSAAKSISPWAAALTTFNNYAMDIMNGPMGGDSQSGSGKSSYSGATLSDFKAVFGGSSGSGATSSGSSGAQGWSLKMPSNFSWSK
nr:MAG TPA: hypothetical protein [Caudoviricetes sp.]